MECLSAITGIRNKLIHSGDPNAPLVVEKVVVEFVKAKD
jgi:hypothetical protein